VDYVFRRLYGGGAPAGRFLVAGEVGLGKTLVARGVIARALEHLHDRRRRIDAALHEERYALIGQLRQTLARVCLDALEPNLVILDEIQRFRDLLDGEEDAAELARALFNYQNVRILLLSATPYKMLSLDHEAEDDHYPDFLRTLDFLLGHDGSVADIGEAVHAYRRGLLSMDAPGLEGAGIEGTSSDAARTAKRRLEDQLLRIMCRTERVGLTRRRDAMLAEPPMIADLHPEDLRQVRLADLIAREGQAPDVVEYWKSSPYLLNFARHYKPREVLKAVAAAPSAHVREGFAADASALLRFACDHRSGRLRGMPTLALMLPSPVLAEMLDSLGLALEPASTLATKQAPALTPDVAIGSAPMDLRAILHLASQRVAGQLAPLLAGVAAPSGGREDERWYWAAPLLLEQRAGSRLAHWCRDPDYWSVADSGPGEADGDGGDEDGADTLFSEHVDHLIATAEGQLDPPLGAPPADLAGVLAELALAGPGNCALRALRRIAPEVPFDDPSLLSGAAAVVHWNLPANPVDLEQREGRVHRYKGHAVRKNIARAYGLPTLRADWDRYGDPWQRMFALANRDKEPGTSDLVPYWIFEHPRGARVERRVPLLPFSRDAARLDRLKIGLALYRLVFGQPRQEDLLAFLGQASPEAQATFGDLILSLEPPANGEGQGQEAG
jgi:hypothetical protein